MLTDECLKPDPEICYDESEMRLELATIFRSVSQEVIEKYGIVLTFSLSRIQSRLLQCISKLGLAAQEEEEGIKMIASGCTNHQSIDPKTIDSIMSCFISYVGSNRAKALVANSNGKMPLPIAPQYAIAFNDEKFARWISKTAGT